MTRRYGPIDSIVTEDNSDKRFISLNFFLLITFSLVFFVYNYIVKCTLTNNHIILLLLVSTIVFIHNLVHDYDHLVLPISKRTINWPTPKMDPDRCLSDLEVECFDFVRWQRKNLITNVDARNKRRRLNI